MGGGFNELSYIFVKGPREVAASMASHIKESASLIINFELERKYDAFPKFFITKKSTR